MSDMEKEINKLKEALNGCGEDYALMLYENQQQKAKIDKLEKVVEAVSVELGNYINGARIDADHIFNLISELEGE